MRVSGQQAARAYIKQKQATKEHCSKRWELLWQGVQVTVVAVLFTAMIGVSLYVQLK